MNGFAGCGGWYGSIMGLIFLGITIWFVFLLIGQSHRRNFDSNTNNQNASAIEILKKRYARGEISKDEFERIKKEIL